MTEFSKKIEVDNKVLDFRFSLIHTLDSKRYFVVVSENDSITSFYLQQDPAGKWELSDRFKVVPEWIYALEADLHETIHQYEQTGDAASPNN